MEKESPQIAITDVDHEYRHMCKEIAKVLHEKNPFEFPVSRRRKFKDGYVVGETVKVCIERLYKELCK